MLVVPIMVTAIAIVLIVQHDDLSQLDELIEAVFDGIVQVLTLLLGAGGVALGAYQSGRKNGKQG